MHRLDRTVVVEPVCLAGYNYKTHKWADLDREHYRMVRASLSCMQENRCAYCEGPIYGDDGHVEHFFRKNPAYFPKYTFEWTNLFLSCNSDEHCGHYKDRKDGEPYNPADLVKPDIHEPDHYFYFHSSGEVRVRSKINAEDRQRADTTIRVFNLNIGGLRGERRRAIKRYEKGMPEILDFLMGCDEQERNMFIEDEIQATRSSPFCTVIRHYFEKVG